MRAIIQNIYPDDNYGFLRADGERMDRFFHGGSVADDSPVPFSELEEGDIVRCEPDDGESRPRVAEKSICLLAKDNGDVNTVEEREEL